MFPYISPYYIPSQFLRDLDTICPLVPQKYVVGFCLRFRRCSYVKVKATG